LSQIGGIDDAYRYVSGLGTYVTLRWVLVELTVTEQRYRGVLERSRPGCR